ncbi:MULTISPECIES: ABC transporter substrate-binding protein [unclassified Streptomyces]|uniref:ABC transporter substrate-binding protein n=1 Tax=Streptomyces sp. NBC_00180 TaxID=2903632 RepID=A0AAU1I4A1_9ACTN|nr:ABC transporter substrate-binding protein [Streptomyces sp. NBC_01017]
MNNAKIGTALLGGYLLGRSKKAKLALGLGALLAGSRMNPGQVGKALHESPFVHTLTDQVRSELTGAGKAAATNLLSAKAGNLADVIHERTSGLQGRAEAQDEEQEEEEEQDEEQDEENGEEPRGKSQGKSRQSRQKARSETSRNSGRGKSGKQGEEQPRKRKTSTSQSRSGSSSGGGARSRRRDDG